MPYGVEIKRSDIAKCIDSLKITDRTLTNILAKFCENNDLKKIKNGVEDLGLYNVKKITQNNFVKLKK